MATAIPCAFHIRLSTDCLFNEVCIDGACVAPMKKCTADCSSHGECQFINANTGSLVDECRERDSSCTVQCVCESNYLGSVLCDMNSTELQSRMVLRSKLLENVGTLVSTEYPTIEALRDWTDLLSETSRNPDELNGTSSSYVLNISYAILVAGKSLATYSSSVLNLLSPIDSATSAMGKDSGSQGTNGSAVLHLLQQCGTAIASTMSPSQYAIQSIQSQFRLSVVFLSSASTGPTAPVSLPQNALEVAGAIQPSKWSIHSQESASNAITITSATAISLRSALAPTLPAGHSYDANPVVLSLSSLPCSASSTNSNNASHCAVDFSLPHSDPSSLLPAFHNESEVVSIPCQEKVRRSFTHKCSNGYTMVVTCDGSFTGQLNSTCPTIRHRNICYSYGDASGSCVLQSSTSMGTICRCYFQSPIHHRHRQLTQSESESDGGPQSVGAVAVLQSLVDNTQITITSAASLDGDTVSKQYTVLVTIGTLVMVILAAFYAAQKADAEDSSRKDFKSVGPKTATNHFRRMGSGGGQLSSSGPRSKKVASLDEGQLDLVMWEDSLPKVFSSRPFSERLYSEIKHHHRWLGIIFYYSETFSRSLRVLAISTKIILMLFVQALTYDFTSPDDGSCGSMKNRIDCLQQKSPFATGQSKCVWQDSSSSSSSCSFVQPSDNFKIILYVAIFSTLISTPIEYVLNSIILLVLAADVDDHNSIIDPTIPEMNNNDVLSIDSPKVLEQMANLTHAIQVHRQRLSPELCSDFDGMYNALYIYTIMM